MHKIKKTAERQSFTALNLRFLLLFRIFQRCFAEFFHCLFDFQRSLTCTSTGCLVTVFQLSFCIFFEFAWIGIPITVVAIAYMMFIGKYLLPKAELDANQEIEQEIEATVHDSKKQIISGLILAVVIVVMALDLRGNWLLFT